MKPCRNKNCYYHDNGFMLNCKSNAIDDCKKYKPQIKSNKQLKFKKLYRKYRAIRYFALKDVKFKEDFEENYLGYNKCRDCYSFDINKYLNKRMFYTVKQNLHKIKTK